MALLEAGELLRTEVDNSPKLKPNRLARPVSLLFVRERFFWVDGCGRTPPLTRRTESPSAFSPPDDPDFATRLRNGLGVWANGGHTPPLVHGITTAEREP